MSAWIDELASLSEEERLIVAENLRSFARTSNYGRAFLDNLDRDEFLPRSAAKAFLDLLLSDQGSDPSKVEHSYELICFKFSLNGPALRRASLPENIGRAVHPDGWSMALFDANPHVSKEEIDELIEGLEEDNLAVEQAIMLSQMWMSPYGVWVTWHLESSGENAAFSEFNAYGADSIRGSLGLSPSDLGEPLLLLRYKEEDVSELRTPTSADAALNFRFRPPRSEFEGFGLTAPWLPDELGPKVDKDKLKLIAMPEAVHGPTKFVDGLNVERREPEDGI